MQLAAIACLVVSLSRELQYRAKKLSLTPFKSLVKGPQNGTPGFAKPPFAEGKATQKTCSWAVCATAPPVEIILVPEVLRSSQLRA